MKAQILYLMTTTTPPPPEKKRKTAAASKKKTPLDSAVLTKRRTTVEARIVKLEGKLSKDRALLVRYAQQQQKLEAASAKEQPQALQ